MAFWLKPENRCLVPATGFSTKSRRGSKSISLERAGGLPIFFAAIWRPGRAVAGVRDHQVEKTVKLFAVVMAEPGKDWSPVRAARLPLLVDRPQWTRWLTGSVDDALDFCRNPHPWRLQIEDSDGAGSS